MTLPIYPQPRWSHRWCGRISRLAHRLAGGEPAGNCPHSGIDAPARWLRGRWTHADIVLDRWSNVNAWGTRLEPLRARLLGNNFSGGTRWPHGEPRPRTCSYCGSVHPEDAIALLLRGWTVESTGKSYKRYLHPPGYEAWAGHPTSAPTGRMPVLYGKPPLETPIPPVKVYVHHLTVEQVRRFNAAQDEMQREVMRVREQLK